MSENGPTLPSLLTAKLLQAKLALLNPAPPVSLSGSKSIEDALEILRSKSIGSVLVKGPGDSLEGIFTEQDAVRRVSLSSHNRSSTTLRELMTPDPHTLRARASIARAIYSMAKGGYRHLPIVDSEGKATGMLSVKDTVHYIFGLIEKETNSVESGRFLNAEALSEFLSSAVENLGLEPAVSLTDDKTCGDALKLMAERKVGAIGITRSNGTLVGIFSERDFITKISQRKDWLSPAVSLGVTENPTIARLGSTIRQCVRLMSEGGYRHIPIVNRDEKLLHIVSVRNFLNSFGDSVVKDLEQQHSSAHDEE